MNAINCMNSLLIHNLKSEAFFCPKALDRLSIGNTQPNVISSYKFTLFLIVTDSSVQCSPVTSEPIPFCDEVKLKMEPIDEDVCVESQETQGSIETQVWVKLEIYL